jgi:hypothetical protein
MTIFVNSFVESVLEKNYRTDIKLPYDIKFNIKCSYIQIGQVRETTGRSSRLQEDYTT